MRKDINFNGLILVFFLIIVIGLGWLIFAGTDIAFKFGLFFILSLIVTIFIILLYNEEKLGFVIPIQEKFSKALILYLFGLSIPVVLLLILFVVGSVSSQKFDISVLSGAISPLSSLSLNSQTKTFSSLVIANDPFWSSFIVRRVASIIEEIAIGFGLFMLLVATSASFIVPALGLKLSKKSNFFVNYSFAMIVSIIIFSALHIFNGSYTTFGDFAFAAILRGILNSAIYFLKFGLEFAIGVHEGLNTISRYLENKALFLQGLLDWRGLIEVIILAIVIIAVFLTRKKLGKDIKEIFSFKTKFREGLPI